MPETYKFVFEGVHLRMHSSHVEADKILAAAGWKIPAIPPGCNTATFYFQTNDGLQALAINQGGFTPESADNESEVNGCSIIVCLDKSLDLIDARRILKRFSDQML